MKMDKAKVENCIAKTRAFYDTKAVGCALLKVKNIATLPSPALSLTDYTFPDDVYKYLDARAQCTIERLAQRAELADDTVPAEGPWYGIAEHTAFLGGRVDYESDTSWHYAMLDAPGELEKLAMDENNPVFRMVNGGIAYLREKYSDYFLPMVRGASGAPILSAAVLQARRSAARRSCVISRRPVPGRKMPGSSSVGALPAAPVRSARAGAGGAPFSSETMRLLSREIISISTPSRFSTALRCSPELLSSSASSTKRRMP